MTSSSHIPPRGARGAARPGARSRRRARLRRARLSAALRRLGRGRRPSRAIAGADVLVTGASAGIGEAAAPSSPRTARACTWSPATASASRPRRGRVRGRLGAGRRGRDRRPGRATSPTSTRCAPSPLAFASGEPGPARRRPQRRGARRRAPAHRPGPRADLRHPRPRPAAAHRPAGAGAARRGSVAGGLRLLGRHVHGARCTPTTSSSSGRSSTGRASTRTRSGCR